VKYYKTYEPEYFDLAHSKNMSLKLATGDIIGQIDADNFTGPGYTSWVREAFRTNGPDTVTTTLRKDAIPYRDQGGKLCLSRRLLYSVNGYDESLVGYGMDDVDLVNRLEKAGGKRIFIERDEHLRFIDHSDTVRLRNYHYFNQVQNIYYYVDDLEDGQTARFLYLFKDNTFSEMNYTFRDELKTNLVVTYGGWTVEQHGDKRNGRFERRENELALMFDDDTVTSYRHAEAKLVSTGLHTERPFWKEVPGEDNLYTRAVFGYCECQNRLKYLENDRDIHSINENGWGKGTVYCNFDTSHPIQVL
jgi:hypothetical protein